MDMPRRHLVVALAIGAGGLLTGCDVEVGGGGTGVHSAPLPGPADAQEALAEAKLATPPDGAEAQMVEREPFDGYAWAREVTFSAPAGSIDGWAEDSFGGADALQPALVVSAQMREVFDVDSVPDTWRMLQRTVSGTHVGIFVIVDDADPAAVRIHLRRTDD